MLSTHARGVYALRVPVLCLIALGLTACGPSRAVLAVQQNEIRLKASGDEVMAAAGAPDLILADRGAETFYFKGGDHTVSVVLVDDTVVAFDDRASWPAAAAALAEEADHSVATGDVRIGQTEADVVTRLGEPAGLTAAGGVEMLHWLTDDEVDSVVQLKGGRVHGFWDQPITALSQNLPTADRDNSTTSGRLRLGMTEREVADLIGEPDSRAGRDGVTVHRYESDPLFGDEINYAVGYKDGKVVELSEHNVSRAEEQAEEVAARKAAEAALARQQKAAEARRKFLSNPAVRAALAASILATANQSRARGQTKTIKRKTVRSSEKRTLKINGTTYRGGAHLGRACSLDQPCPAAYKCHLVTSSSGMCVQ